MKNSELENQKYYFNDKVFNHSRSLPQVIVWLPPEQSARILPLHLLDDISRTEKGDRSSLSLIKFL